MKRDGMSRVSVLALSFALGCLCLFVSQVQAGQGLNQPPEGFIALFNGRDLSGWQGLVANPPARAKMSAEQLGGAREKANQDMRQHWSVQDGVLMFDGHGHSLCTVKDYANFDMFVDWKIEAGGDSGIYLRGSPQVQIWDNAVGSGGLYNNAKHPSKPLVKADNPVGQWNTFRIIMIGERVTVYLNDVLVVDDVVMENYWQRDRAIYPADSIELQSHGSILAFRNVFIRELSDELDPRVEAALEMAQDYQFGQSRSVLQKIETVVGQSGQGHPGLRGALQERFLEQLACAEVSTDYKRFVCRQLSLIGDAGAVGGLAALLGDQELADMARFGLERIPVAEATAALRDKLVQVSGKQKIGIVNSLGVRRDGGAVESLVAFVGGDDVELASAAGRALGNIANEQACQGLMKARAGASGQVKAVLTDACLACAERMHQEGKSDRALAILRKLYSVDEPVVIRVGALSCLAKILEPAEAGQLMVEALVGDEPSLQRVAIGVIRTSLPGTEHTRTFAATFDKLQPDFQALLLDALADRDDRAALPLILKAVDATEEAVCLAALAGVGRLGDGSAVKLLVEKAAQSEDGPVAKVARHSLDTMAGADVDAKMLALLGQAGSVEKLELIRSLTERHHVAAVASFIELAGHGEADVRLGALKGIETLGGVEDLGALVGLVVGASAGAEREQAQKAVVAATRRGADQDSAAKVVLAALPKAADAAVQAALLEVAGRIGGVESRRVLLESLGSGEGVIQEVAVKALADWGDAAPAEALFTFAAKEQNEQRLRVLALRGYIRLAGLPSNRAADQTVAMYGKAFKSAWRTDEKKLILAGLANVAHGQALALVGGALDDKALEQEAIAAALKLGGKLGAEEPKAVKALMERVVALSSDAKVKKQAQDIIGKTKK